jgi:hypothetical protein
MTVRKPKPNSQASTSISALLRQPNPWSDWMSNTDHEPLSTLRFMALMLRELPVPWLIDRLAPALEAADREGQRQLEQQLRDYPMPDGVTFGFEHWLSFWDQGGSVAYDEALIDVVDAIGGSDDLALFSAAMTRADVDRTALLWFLLNGMAEWAAYNGDPFAVGKDGAWLAELLTEGLEETVDWPDQDPLGVLFAYLYGRFRERTDHATMPIPRDFAPCDDTADYFSSAAPKTASETRLLRSITSESGEPAPSLSDILGDDARHWPKVASNVGSLRRQGLLSTTSLHATPAGTLRASQEQDAARWRCTEISDDGSRH